VIGEILKSDSEELVWVKEVSGLTWEQLGKVLGVSRRSVHLWANGGRMNESNAAVLRAFSAAVNRIPGNSPDEKRSGLLAIGPDGQSIVDRFRRRQGKLAGTAWGSPFTVDELLGALPDERFDE
jgi:hypothetical protein